MQDTAKEIKSQINLRQYLIQNGFEMVKKGAEHACRCPFHNDKEPSLRVSDTENMWYCDPCKVGGSIIDFYMRWKNVGKGDAIKELAKSITITEKPKKAIEVCAYSYKDAHGQELYQAVRYAPKTFRQRHMVAGSWVYSMDGIERVLYNLPEVLASESVWIVEGEKDADTLNSIGLVATCNVGGAGKWLDAYSESLLDKKIYICPDNDKVGQEHCQTVIKALEGKVKSISIVSVPEPCKDVSEHLFRFTTETDKFGEMCRLGQKAKVLHRGIDLPIKSIDEMRTEIAQHAELAAKYSWEIDSVFPSLHSRVEPLVPGDVVIVMAATGVGKTALLQNMAVMAAPKPVVFCEQELASRHLSARFLQIANGLTYKEVLASHLGTRKPISSHGLEHIFCCCESGLTIERLQKLIQMSELKLGQKPLIVFVDYLQLMQGKGERYERMSNIADGLRSMANNLGVILVVASQIHRKENNDGQVHLHDAKDSGSIENSSSLALGAWRDQDDGGKMRVRVLKCSNGDAAGLEVCCRFAGGSMQIRDTEFDKPKKLMPVAYKEADLPEQTEAPF